MLRAEGGAELEIPAPRQRVQRMFQRRCYRGRMGQQGDALAVQIAAQVGV